MTTPPDGLKFNADDVRTIVIRARLLGLRRERVFAALTQRRDSLTDMEFRRIFDEEWPSEEGRRVERGSPRPDQSRAPAYRPRHA